jgi:hypothetical protein
VSTLRVNQISTKSGTGNIRVLGGKIISPGSVVQTIAVRSDLRATYASNNSGNGTPITPLNLTITPVFANSLIVCQWMISGEMSNDDNFLIWRDGVLAIDGYNLESGNVRWSGYSAANYDANDASTPFSRSIIYTNVPGSTLQTTYGLAVRSSSATNYTFYFNRTVSSTGADGYETSVSAGIIQEIAQ